MDNNNNKPNKKSGAQQAINWLYDQFTGDDEDSRVCKDIPDAACKHQPRNFFAYLVANLFGKIADELASARLVLPWLLSTLGAPASLAGFLVPIRESGVLIPQLLVAAYIRRLAIRKIVWLIGALLSAITMLFMALTTWSLSGTLAGWVILIMLVLYSLARGLCSVSAKDVLGKTVSKTRRGALMGYSVAISSVFILLIGLMIQQMGDKIQSIQIFLLFLVAAAISWILGILAFNAIRETPGATEGGGNALTEAIKSLRLLKTDLPFRQYVIMRILLLSSALMPPFFVILAQQQTSDNISGLGWLIIANSLAGALSAVVWGKLSDRSSRLVMAVGSAITMFTGLLTWMLAGVQSDFFQQPLVYAFLFFLISLAHSGIRLGRKVYLVDMANMDNRSSYVAVSNTVIGLVMLLAGSVGILGDIFGVGAVILLLSIVSFFAAVYALRAPEISG